MSNYCQEFRQILTECRHIVDCLRRLLDQVRAVNRESEVMTLVIKSGGTIRYFIRQHPQYPCAEDCWIDLASLRNMRVKLLAIDGRVLISLENGVQTCSLEPAALRFTVRTGSVITCEIE